MNDSDILSPVSNVQIVHRDMLKPNDYNPNIVSEKNMELLTQSILSNGWTLPIVIRPDYTIIDGFHRWTVSGREPLLSKLKGMVPVVIVKHEDKAQDIYGTITHNRARGVHQLAPMKRIINDLFNDGKTVNEISKELGMSPEEVFRLSSFSKEEFLSMMARSDTYSKAVYIVKY
ncbi:MAG: ParB N-terminal domain-containing protein [Syntrophorhabdaceae bacterium]|jgi:ParB-like chromosome segregation protein Spo0J|nr:ParB N-terminal domain-containing protein [Syntrophorhabdaceae bacterium]